MERSQLIQARDILLKVQQASPKDGLCRLRQDKEQSVLELECRSAQESSSNED